MAYTYDYPHPAVTADVVVFTVHDDALAALLVRRSLPPFEGRWALPGGFVGIRESLRRAAWRELREETGVRAAFLAQVGAFGQPDRDPRERVVSVAYYTLLPFHRLEIRAGSDAGEVRVWPVAALPDLAFDHDRILRRARERMRADFDDSVIGLRLPGETFTLAELQRVYEILLDRRLDKRNFRKRVLGLGMLESTGATRRAGAHRPAALYRVRAGPS